MRFKTFNATGVAPDGRLYAGDLNGIQDLYLPLSDFTSTVDVGTLRIGDPTLQLYKYGAGEFRMTGHMRFDGIVRTLGGLVSGAFTTAQRDAIPSSSRPYGIVILNTTLNQYQWNKGTDNSPVWESFGVGLTPGAHAASHAPGASDPIDYTGVHMRGTLAARPAAAAGNNGLLYFAYDEVGGTMYRSTGSAWEKSSLSAGTPAAIPPGAISAFAGPNIPAGWLYCDGAAYSRSTYSALFAQIGGYYGAPDANTFNVPDMRGRVLVGVGTHGDVAGLNYGDGLGVNSRTPRHYHRIFDSLVRYENSPWSIVTGGGGFNSSNQVYAGDTSKPPEGPAYLCMLWMIKT